MKPFLNRFVNLFVLRLSQDDICLFSLSLLHSWWLWYAGVPDTQIWPCHGIRLLTHCSVYISRGWGRTQKMVWWYTKRIMPPKIRLSGHVLKRIPKKSSKCRFKTNKVSLSKKSLCDDIPTAPPSPYILRPLIFEVVFFLLKKAQRSSVIYFNHKCHHRFLFLLILFNILLS